MFTLHRYVSRELMRGFSIAFVVLILIIFVGFALRYIHQGLDIIEMKFIFPHLALQSFPYSVPLALLISVIMTYGRLSGDNEITALRSSGIHLQMIVTPTMVIAVLFSIFMFFVISRMVPQSERSIRDLLLDAKTWSRAIKLLGRSARRTRLQGWLIYVVNQDEDRTYHGISIYKVSQEFVSEMYDARKGRIDIDEESNTARVHLEDGIFTKSNYENPDDVKTMHFRSFDVNIPVTRGEEPGENEDPKYMSLSKMIRARSALRERVRTHPEIFRNPQAAQKEWGKVRDRIDVENSVLYGELRDTGKALERIDREEEKNRRDLAECGNSRKDCATAATSAKKHWERLREEVEAKSEELSRRQEEQRKLLEKMTPTKATPENKDGKEGKEGQDGNRGTQETALSDDDAKRLRQLNREIAGLNEAKLRLDTEVASAKDVYDGARENLDNVEKRIKDIQASIDRCTAQRAALDLNVEEKGKELAASKVKREEANTKSCQAAEQQKEYEFRIRINERIALSFSCLAFVLAAVPLGIYSKHGHVLVALAIGLGLVLIYFGLFLVGRTLAEGRYLPCEIPIWSANFILAAMGAALLASVFRK